MKKSDTPKNTVKVLPLLPFCDINGNRN